MYAYLQVGSEVLYNTRPNRFCYKCRPHLLLKKKPQATLFVVGYVPQIKPFKTS